MLLRWHAVLVLLAASVVVAALGCPHGLGPTAGAPAGDAAPRQLHALLLNGGGQPSSNYYSHVDHLRRLIGLLDAAALDRSRITVFSGDGDDPGLDLATREGELPDDFWLLPKASLARWLRPPIVYENTEIAGFALRPALKSALHEWFVREGAQLDGDDTLLFYVTDHGKGSPDDGYLDNEITLWREALTVTDARALFELLDPEVRVVMVMSQCFSGGFAQLLFDADGAPPDGHRCGYFSTTSDRKAHGCYPEVSGREDVGHSHRLFTALERVGGLDAANREVMVTDRSPDVPNASSAFYLARVIEQAAAEQGREPQALIDELLAEAWANPRAWEPEIRLLDRVGESFGFASWRSLAELDRDAGALPELSQRLETYTERWKQALDDLRLDNLARFLRDEPGWNQRLDGDRLKQLGAEEREREVIELLHELGPFSRDDRERYYRLEDVHEKVEVASAAHYRAEVRLAAVLRMRALLTEIAARVYLARGGNPAEARALARVDACEDLTLGAPGTALASDIPEPEPFPTLAQERAVVESILPGWLGIVYRPARPSERQRQDLESGATVVTQVLPDSPASEAGMQTADVVIGPVDYDFAEPNALRGWVMRGELGAPTPLRVLRDGEELELTLRLAAYPLELPELPGPPEVGSEAPTLHEEAYYRSDASPSGSRGRMLFFWATWCGPCKAAVPELIAFEREWNVPVVAITDEGVEELDPFFSDRVEPFPGTVLLDSRRVNFQGYGVSGTPTFVWIDENGAVQYHQTGYTPGVGLRIEGWSWEGR